jgi:hypothetical protein
MNSWSQSRAQRATRSYIAALGLLAIVASTGCSSGGDKSPDSTVIDPGSTQMPNGVAGIGSPGGNMLPGANVNSGDHNAVNDPDTANAGGTMPCQVSSVVKTSCQGCHGAVPLGGAPMSLLTVADFTRDYVAKTTKPLMGKSFKMYELARIRINGEMGTTPMPQGMELAVESKATLNTWLTAMAPTGAACTGTEMMKPTMNPPTNTDPNVIDDGSDGSPMSTATTSQCDLPGSRDHLVETAGETCYDFQVHGSSGAGDTSKFDVPVDETYNQFYYGVPWPAGSVATRYGGDYDNLPVLHHWLAFSSISTNPPGTVTPNVTGTTLGENAELIAGWAIGGCNTDYGPDVGVTLPDDGDIMIQWHHFNSTGTPQQDGSKVRICTVPKAARKNIAGITFLGTEAIAIAPGGDTSLGSTCTNNSSGPITILGFTPHMHTIGSHMTSVVTRAGSGKTETVFDKAFVFDQQVNYKQDPLLVLNPGDTIESTCTWTNPSDGVVTFGQSTHDEMCYQFTLSYPYGALNNGVFSLIGATNTCW